MNLVLNQWLAGLLTLAITVLTAINLMPEEAWQDPVSVLQFAALVISSIVAVVVKLGTGVLTDDRKQPDLAQLEQLVAQVANQRQQGR